MSAGRAHSSDDQVLPATRVLSLFIAPFLVLGFGILYLFPDHTPELFAWTIRPRMTAMMLGAAYLGGIYFFLGAGTIGRWHLVQAGFPPVAVFAALLGLTTIIHWDRFNHQHIAFATWAALYFTTPFLVLAAWLRNRPADPGTPDQNDFLVPGPVRSAQLTVGVLILLVGAALFLRPDVAMAVWPWTLTPLTARVEGSLFALAGVAQLSIGWDRRWSSARVTLQSQLVALVAIDLAQQSLSPNSSTSSAASLNSSARQWNMIAMSSIHRATARIRSRAAAAFDPRADHRCHPKRFDEPEFQARLSITLRSPTWQTGLVRGCPYWSSK